MLDKKVKNAVSVVDKVCSEFQGTLKDHQMIQEAIQIIAAALEPTTDKKKIKVSKKALPRDRKRKGKDKK